MGRENNKMGQTLTLPCGCRVALVVETCERTVVKQAPIEWDKVRTADF